MNGKLEGKVAVVSGGNSSIGLATAKRFVAEGAYVFITGRPQAQLDAAVKEIGSNVSGFQGDVANLADLDRLYAAVKVKQGRIDILFANAGSARLAPPGQITEEHFDGTLNTNVKGLAVHRAKGSAANAGWCIDHPGWFGADRGRRRAA